MSKWYKPSGISDIIHCYTKVLTKRQVDRIYIAVNSKAMKKKTKWIVISAVVAVLIINTLLGLFLLSQQQSRKPQQATPTITPGITQTPTITGGEQISAGTTRVKIALIAVGDEGKSGSQIGCGDSIVLVNQDVPKTQAVLKAALEKLFALKSQYFGESGLYNALYQSNIRVEHVAIANGKAAINLSGQLQLGGVCDNPRVEEQIRHTALQFPTVTSVAVFLNGKSLESQLSEKGE